MNKKMTVAEFLESGLVNDDTSLCVCTDATIVRFKPTDSTAVSAFGNFVIDYIYAENEQLFIAFVWEARQRGQNV